MKTRLLSTLLLMLCAITASANDALDRLYGDMEKVAEARVSLSEEKDPETGMIKNVSWIIDIPKKPGRVDVISRVFEQQRQKAFKFHRSDNTYYNVSFVVQPNYQESYTYSVSSNRITLIKTFRPSNIKSETPKNKATVTTSSGEKSVSEDGETVKLNNKKHVK